MRISEDISDLVFRGLFSTIFLGLGMEHLLSDDLLQILMPAWVEPKRLASVMAGIVLLAGGCSILLGLKVHLGATVLAIFLVAVTLLVHGPGLVGHYPPDLPEQGHWIWQVYQRSNFVKNLCLLGVCVHLLSHQPGRYSLDRYFERARAARAGG